MKFLTWAFLLLAMVALSRAAEEEEEEESSKDAEEQREQGSLNKIMSNCLVLLEEKEAGNSTETEGEKHVVKRALRCPGGWRRYGRRCFRYFPRRYTWAQAERYCQVYSGNLASVHNLHEFRAIQGVAYGRNPQ
ncbi:ladderlectin-like, partial [Leuresthes tenuis]|uniref:ladderlectin-like n=1 Tax=Leuresthes tenuis TaxID=355514 RepID=UPI003B50D00A